MNKPHAPGPGPLDRAFAAQGPDARGMSPWLILLAGPLWEVVRGEARPMWLAIPGLVAAAALYLWTIRLAFIDPRKAERGPLPAMGLLTLVLVLAMHSFWYTLFPLFAIACGVAIKGLGRAAAVLMVTIAVACALSLRDGGDWGEVLSLGWGTFTAGLVTAIMLRLFEVIGQLRQTREELARAAVAEERLRFSRDLHDLLGHTLSVMVVKAEAVRRVLPSDAGAAAQQAGDIERIGREALKEVRAAVTGYRGRSLSAELESARTVLGDAGVRLTTRFPVTDLAPETDAPARRPAKEKWTLRVS
ncbi:sensor histidine kinase [Sphaerisporangium perillae]|uniref:sensor histidine kinase n=1 Tax=Sphaerisporangium perillae TaxID=2935860 RepID=UPI00200C5D59|nr:histidine kinase [Sphaerisporangium perillae]